MFQNLQDQFILNFVADNRWQFLWTGLKTTLIVTVLALCIGILLGTVLAMIRSMHDQIRPNPKESVPGAILVLLNGITKVYLTVIRGTPVVVQLLIMYYIIFGSSTNKLLAAVLCFGLNSAAYVAESIRGGIMSIDAGQMEAGRSLGLGYFTVMRFVIIPQAIKNILPALGNELITLLKETSISGFIGLTDITRGADIIRGNTYSAFMPLFGAAAIYLTLVMLLSALLTRFERRMAHNDRG